MTLALVSASAPLLANEYSTQLNNLVTSSGTIRANFDSGLKTLYGAEDLSHTGLIAQDDFIEQMKITATQQYDYNNAVQAYKQARIETTFDLFITDETSAADINMHLAVDEFISASTAVLEVVKVNELSAQAEASGDLEAAQNVQAYVQANDVTLSDQEVSAFNTSVDTVEVAVQTYSAFQAVASSETLRNDLEAEAAQFGADADTISSLFFDTFTQSVSATFSVIAEDGSSSYIDASVSVLDLYANNNDAFDQSGANNPYYTGGATQANAACLLSATDLTSCTGRGNGGNYGGQPPINEFIYDGPNGNIMGFTDENGDFYQFTSADDGDIVYKPGTDEAVGTWQSSQGGLQCYEQYAGYCNA